ncbi:MAG TPA: choice-of-anchor tandem repeat GloVer-containing protein [Terracidiphilus sp.]|nr:choice-of-anchor tandem repeat GloVer-containing protein [Terracidiphilus sp.]
MPAAVKKNLAGKQFGIDGHAQVAGSKNFKHGCLRRFARTAAAGAAAISLFLLSAWQVEAQTFTVIHNFTGSDGAKPFAGLTRDASGNLYGTTSSGGSAAYYGTVFKIDDAGNYSVLHSFNWTAGANWLDGAYPLADLALDASGNLYGTTSSGGPDGRGTVFKIDRAGKEAIFHYFTDLAWYPRAGVVLDASGNLYGTTWGFDGSPSTVFKIDPAGNETDYRNTADGYDSDLVLDSSGNLYGTNEYGGSYGSGSVFRIDAAGNESVLHSFSLDGIDGWEPHSGVIFDSSGNLYGTTFWGGAGGYFGAGIVFKIDPAGHETILHDFNGPGDGEGPVAGLVRDAAGNLYGTTSGGGSGYWGTVFKIDSAGNETILHNFTGGDDGGTPVARLLLDPSGNLYGTTYWGGSANLGTVFKISFPVPFSSFTAKLDTIGGYPPGFQLQGFFTQGKNAPAIDPVTQGMTLSVGTYTAAVPPGLFHQTRKGWWVYEGELAGVSLEVRISQKGASLYELQVDASGVDVTSLPNPVTVALALGNNTGTTEAYK